MLHIHGNWMQNIDLVWKISNAYIWRNLSSDNLKKGLSFERERCIMKLFYSTVRSLKSNHYECRLEMLSQYNLTLINFHFFTSQHLWFFSFRSIIRINIRLFFWSYTQFIDEPIWLNWHLKHVPKTSCRPQDD